MIYNNIYKINFRNLANYLTPPFLRKQRFIDWLDTLLKPVEEVNFAFKKFRKDSIYKVTHNGQVVFLQKVLNDAFDKELRRIKIVDSVVYDPLYIYPEAESLPLYIDEGENPAYVIGGDVAFGGTDIDFVVLMPAELKPVDADALNLSELQIKSLTNYYKLASKRHLILWTL
jgi:hypothetical protein